MSQVDPPSPYQSSVVYGEQSHSLVIGYLLWIFGFTGAHRFYFGRPITGTIWFCTLGLLGIGWLIDIVLIPSMERAANRRYVTGPIDYNVAWLLLTFLGSLGVHRFYLGKWGTGLVYLVCWALASTVILAIPAAIVVALFLLCDFWTLNEQVDERNTYGA
ncbi:TM2 domain-containing protein [Aeoliella sp. SH292]|uniref:TM2 domain-containing protein n=1 Tax=Aeoliella sp. SH292 TaxID=3454464 RepID=UPI003F973DCA